MKLAAYRPVLLTAALHFTTIISASAQTSPFTAEDMLKIASISVLDVTEDGRRIAASVRRGIDNPTVDHRRYGDPTYLAPARVALQVIDTRTGETEVPFKELVNVRDVAWSRDGQQLAILLARDAAGPDAYPTSELLVWNVAKKALATVKIAGPQTIALNSNLNWTPDGTGLIVALRSQELDREARAKFLALTEGPIIVHSSREPFLEWDALQRSTRSRAIATINVRDGSVRTLLPQGRITSYQTSRDGSFMTIMEDVTTKTDYDVIGGTENELKYLDTASGSARTLVAAKDLKGLQLRWSEDGKTFAYAKRGEIFVQSVDGTTARSLTPKPAKPEAANDKPEKAPVVPDAARPDEESFTPVSFSRDSSKLLVTSKKGWYVVNVADARRDLIVPLDSDEEKNPRMSAIAWSPDGTAIYASWSARSEWHRGIVRVDIGSRSVTPLARDARLYSGVRLSHDGSTFVYTLSDGNRPAELHAADVRFATPRKLSELNPWLAAKTLPTSELIGYRDVDGKQLYGVLRYPVGYVKGRTYPTVFEIYETFFDNGFNARAAFLANHGYAVFHPSVNLVVGRPGEAWVKGVTTAANRLIELGIADPDRLGVHGTSYGGYATALLITQTERFKAAINISGKVNMVSFYTDSPRLGVRNTHAPEKSQDRIGGTLWEFPERYLEHSAVLRADRIKTPLLNITGDQDPNVPASQSREMYYAMRRLGKEVEWVRYVDGGHRPPNSVEETIDFEGRILAWYDKHLKEGPKRKPTDNW